MEAMLAVIFVSFIVPLVDWLKNRITSDDSLKVMLAWIFQLAFAIGFAFLLNVITAAGMTWQAIFALAMAMMGGSSGAHASTKYLRKKREVKINAAALK